MILKQTESFRYRTTSLIIIIKCNNKRTHANEYASSDVVEGLPAYDIDYAGSKPFMYNFTSQSFSQSVSSSSLEVEVGVVPGHTESSSEVYPTPLMIGLEREARVLRYREKRKNRKFEKPIRYASRKAYSETRPRIKGRFMKRTELDVEAGDVFVSPECLSFRRSDNVVFACVF